MVRSSTVLVLYLRKIEAGLEPEPLNIKERNKNGKIILLTEMIFPNLCFFLHFLHLIRGLVVQWVKLWPVKRKAAGSNPA